MGKLKKEGKVGPSSKFISRAKAIRKLQINLKDFRKLCILKGIYPREPPKKLQKTQKTYYHSKDINFLAHEKILDKFRQIKIHLRKVKKAKARNEQARLKTLLNSKPKYTLTHLIKERYPSFAEALKDLDDPLCLINLFASFPSNKDLQIDRERIQNCIKLAREFNLFIIKSQSLKKVFLSIKGIYYQAELQGQQVTWIVPYALPPKLPIEVDYRVMLTFLEFYEVFLKFTLYKLFNSINFHYPIQIDQDLDQQQYFSYRSFLLLNQETTEETKQKQAENQKFEISEKFQETQEIQKLKLNQSKQNLFTGLSFWFSSEVPRQSLEFVCLSFGAQVFWQGDGSNTSFDDPKITHFVTDRKPEQIKKMLKNREYIQPQWVYDSVNNQLLLPVSEYQPGKLLPPHLSPFATERDELYIPERQKELDKLKGIEREPSEKDEEVDFESDDESEIEVEEDAKGEVTDLKDAGSEDQDESEENEVEADSDESSEELQLVGEDSVDEDIEGDDIVFDEEEEHEFDIVKAEQNKQKLEKKTEKENKQLAEKMMSKKNRNLKFIIDKQKQEKQEQANQLKKKARKLKNKTQE